LAGAKYAAVLIGLGTVYFVAAAAGLRLAFLNPSATPVWPPTGIALAAILFWGSRVWPAIFTAAFLVNVMTAGTAATSAGIALGNTLEAVLGAYLVNRFAGGRDAFESARGVVAFGLLAGVLSTTVSATFGVTSLALGDLASSDLGAIWLTWWLGDAGGALVVAPVLVLWARRPVFLRDVRRWPEAAALIACLVGMGQLVFGGVLPAAGSELPLEFLSVPVLLWAAMRFSPRVAATAALLMSAVAVRGTFLGLGPFARAGPNASLLLVQSFMVVASGTTLILAAVVTERRRAAAALRELSERDALTGLANFRLVQEVLGREIDRCGRTGRAFSVLLLDVDGLKQINDRLGHLAGNRALCRVADAMRAGCRVVDTAARFGGDEFAVVLPETDATEAASVAVRVSERLSRDPEDPRLTISHGLAEYPRDASTPEGLLARADEALYEMKRARADRSAQSRPETSAPPA
jgi:diguanylate cyclase (GGDEF)-like protein